MKTLKQRTQDNKSMNFTIRFMASYSILLLIILFMGLYLYFISLRNIRSGIREQNLTSLQNSIAQFDMDLASMSALGRQMASDSTLVRLSNLERNEKGTFYLLAYQAKKGLAKFLPSYMLLPIDSYFIRLRNTDYLLSFDHFGNSRSYYERDRLLAPDKFDSWKNYLDDPASCYRLYPISNFSNSYTKNPDNYYYVMPLEDFSSCKIPADLCYELDMGKINQIFSELNLFGSGFICVANAEGTPVLTIRPGQAAMDNEEELEALLRLQSLTYDKKGFSSYRTEGESMLVTAVVSDHYQWTYYLVQPAQAAYYSTGSYQTVFLVCIFVALFSGFILIVILSRKNSRPLIDLSSELTETKLKQQKLLDLARQQEPLLRTSYIRQMMKGTISTPEEMEYVREYLKLGDEEHHQFLVLYCSIYLNKYEVDTGGSNVVGIAPSDYDAIIREAMARCFGGPLCLFSPHDRCYALLITVEKDAGPESVHQQYAEAFTGLHDYLMKEHSISIFAGLGDLNKQLAFTWKSYQQAREAVRYTSAERIICYYDDLSHNSHNYYYPDELAKQLTVFVETGNKQQVAEIFKVIKSENLARRSLSFHQMNWLLSDIRSTLLKVRFTIHEDDTNSEVLNTLDRHFEEIPALQLYENMAVTLCETIRHDTSEHQLISRIKEYVFHNYRDPALCLSRISEEFSISECYFSSLFKKITGENFSVYLENLRMEQALHMIKDTNARISTLYMELGYNNPTSFRRAFKKIYGVSPNALRGGQTISKTTEQNDSEEE